MRWTSIRLILILFASLATVTGASAGWVSVGDGSGLNVSVLESSSSRVVLQYTLGGFEQTPVMINGREYAKIGLPREAITQEAGSPELPLVARSVIIPDDRMMKLRLVSSEYVDLAGIDPVPSKGNLLRTIDPESVPYTFGSAYNAGGWYPTIPIGTREPYILRDYRGQTVMVTPIVYEPSGHTLRVYTRMVVELADAGPGGANVLVRNGPPEVVNEAFSPVYQTQFLNFGYNLRYQEVPEAGSMLIICFDSFASAVQPLVDWKNEMGLPTTMVLKSAVGTTAAQFQTYIQNYYNSSNPRVAFVLLVGDAAQIPTPSASGGASDPTYSKVAGSDNYPDIFVGRFSAETVAQVQTQVTRTIDYERNPLLAGGTWYPKGTGIGSAAGPGDDGEMDWQHIDRIRGELITYGYATVDQIYDPGATAATVTAALNDGRTIVNYCGHGSQNAWTTSGFSSTNVNQLANDHKLPFIFSVACVNGQFDGGTCFGEAWLRATHNGVPSGAVGAYMSSINQSWNPPMAAEDEADRLLVADEARSYGSLCFNGSCQMMDEYGSDGVAMFNTWIVFGDPSLRVRTKTPLALNVTAPDFIDPTASTYELDVAGVGGALCGLSYQGLYLGSGVSDVSGHAVINVVGTLPQGQALDLTVTAYNRIPFFGQVQVQVPVMPLAVVNPGSFEFWMAPDASITDTLHISNNGDPASTLIFTAHFAPMLSGVRFTIDPDHGSLAFGDSLDLIMTVSSLGVRNGDYTGSLMVDYYPSQTTTLPIVIHVADPADVTTRGTDPIRVELQPAQPNPFADATLIRYGLPAEGAVHLAIYDATGRMVRLLASGAVASGYHPVAWDGRDDNGRSVATGVYFARLQTSGATLTSRLLRVR
jgi:hypothetical protein